MDSDKKVFEEQTKAIVYIIKYGLIKWYDSVEHRLYLHGTGKIFLSQDAEQKLRVYLTVK